MRGGRSGGPSSPQNSHGTARLRRHPLQLDRGRRVTARGNHSAVGMVNKGDSRHGAVGWLVSELDRREVEAKLWQACGGSWGNLGSPSPAS